MLSCPSGQLETLFEVRLRCPQGIIMTTTLSPASISYCQAQGEVESTGMVDKSVEQRKVCAL